MKLWLDAHWQRVWQGQDPFAAARALQGQVYRSKEGRRTLRIEQDGRGYFLKWHGGVGWGEIAKNLLQGRAPVLGARCEYDACRRLAALGVATMTPVAFGERGLNPARQESFLITEELAGTISLEDYCRPWAQQAPSIREKRALVRQLAHISKTLHDHGINHRDYYLCHFLRADNHQPFRAGDALYLIDLHRVQQRPATPLRWRVKDLAGLFYSAFELPLTRRDILCFLSVYRREWLANPPPALAQVAQRALALYRKDFGREPPAAILTLLHRSRLP